MLLLLLHERERLRAAEKARERIYGPADDVSI